jgi:hypothetical protein
MTGKATRCIVSNLARPIPEESENRYFPTHEEWPYRAKFPTIDDSPNHEAWGRKRWPLMLDNPEKTARLVAALKAAVPFEVELPATFTEHLRDENLADLNLMHPVWDLSYADDDGGIMCHMARSEETGRALFISLTYVRVPHSMPLARAVADYQKHRVKKIKKQGGTSVWVECNETHRCTSRRCDGFRWRSTHPTG